MYTNSEEHNERYKLGSMLWMLMLEKLDMTGNNTCTIEE